jgi:hypothetical protein
MTNQFWFKPKTFGYGATPITWEGWALTLGFALVIAGCVVTIIRHKESLPTFVTSLVIIVVATIVLTAVSVQKTDGAWGWNAGARKNTGKQENR